MTPHEHYDEAERLLDEIDNGLGLIGRNQFDPQIGQGLATVQIGAAKAQAHATLALAGFARDAATGADHVHDVITVEPGTAAASSWPTTPGRPA